ncbi:hypothetical protein PQQ86_00060 [Paraburkholderia sediminicola]|uniref:hypothetical protein n=1 Tax=Paraburkholderia TaxID=1822464 RepID=UPI0038B787AA
MEISREEYLASGMVPGFVAFFGKLLSGKEPLSLTLDFTNSRRLPADYDTRLGRRVKVTSLQQLFKSYWWDGGYLEDNNARLRVIDRKISRAVRADCQAWEWLWLRAALFATVDWAFGGRQSRIDRFMMQANNSKHLLLTNLRAATEALLMDKVDLSLFGQRERSGLTMNATWVKFFALACAGVIYDGRVGAGTGYLVRLYLESLPENERSSSVPDELHFRWAAGEGRRNRNPSSGLYRFAKLTHSASGAIQWARCAVQLNWIIAEAIKVSDASWCSGTEGKRNVEAALFMMGYDMPIEYAPRRSDQVNLVSLHW